MAALVLGAGCRHAPDTVTRVAGGVPYEGRYVSPEAYAYYARGASLEARGDPGALDAYERALAEDPESAEVLARIGAVRCRLARRAGDPWARTAEAALGRALSADPRSATAWRERALCHDRFGRADAALEAALEAAEADPDSLDSTLLVARLAERAGAQEVARTWLDALVAREPDSQRGWQTLLEWARRQGDAPRAMLARGALGELGTAPSAARSSLEARIRVGDAAGARREALRLRVPSGTLAALALELGALALAKDQAELVLAADPDDADAWVTCLLVAELEHDAAAFEQHARRAPMPAVSPSPLAAEAWAALLERAVGKEARAAFERAARR